MRSKRNDALIDDLLGTLGDEDMGEFVTRNAAAAAAGCTVPGAAGAELEISPTFVSVEPVPYPLHPHHSGIQEQLTDFPAQPAFLHNFQGQQTALILNL